MTTETTQNKPVEVYTERTFSSDTLKFVTNVLLLKDVGADFPNQKQAKASPLASLLFEHPAVQNVFIYQNFVSITKKENVEWFELQARLRHRIKNYLEEGKPVIDGNYKLQEMRAINPQADDPEPVKKAKKVLAEEIRPAIGVDGGAVKIVSYKDGTVYITFQGAYCNCPSSKATVRSSVEALLKEKVKGIEKVRMHESEVI